MKTQDFIKTNLGNQTNAKKADMTYLLEDKVKHSPSLATRSPTEADYNYLINLVAFRLRLNIWPRGDN